MRIPEILIVEVEHAPGSLARVLTVIGDAGVVVENVAMVARLEKKSVWEITLDVDEDFEHELVKTINLIPRTRVIGLSDRVFNYHRGGKIRTVSTMPVRTMGELRDIYTPGVSRVSLAIQRDPSLAADYTSLQNTVAIITNGTAVLGLGDIGPLAGLPVIEGKAALFAEFSGVSGVPILLEQKDPQRFIDAVIAIAPSFGAIQLEDIAAPACFEIEKALVERIGKPVLHDDQHATGVAVLAALISAARLVGLDLKKQIVGQIGLGAAGMGIARLLHVYGVRELVGTDIREEALQRFANIGGHGASLDELMQRATIVIATSGVRGLIKPEMIRKGQLILALTNPNAEIEPEIALARGAAYAADGKSVNNVLVYPGLFRGALDARAKRFTDAMLLAAAETISAHAPQGQLVPSPVDRDVHRAVAAAVREACFRDPLSGAKPQAAP